MKKKISTVILIIVILLGLGFILYPTISDYLKTLAYNRAIEYFKKTIAVIDDKSYDDIVDAAKAYNKRLLDMGSILPELSDTQLIDYKNQLKIDDTGIIGYVVIPKINTTLPIYHGTDEMVLQSGVGHLEGSSLPIGGEGSHSVLSGHRGLPSAKLFTNIDQLEVGDTFTVRVLKDVLTYEVDEIQTVLPWKVNALKIVEGEDYCTLLTCTPYGVNSHRLLVRGHRIPTPEEEKDAEEFDRVTTNKSKTDYFPLIATGIATALLLLIIIASLIRRRNRRRANDIA